MGLKSVIQNLMPKVMTALGDIPVSATYHATGTIAYNPTTGVKSETGGVDTVLDKIVMADYTVDEVDHKAILVTDKKLMIPYIDLASEPHPIDTITIGSSVYKVISKRIDPAEGMWIIQVRL